MFFQVLDKILHKDVNKSNSVCNILFLVKVKLKTSIIVLLLQF